MKIKLDEIVPNPEQPRTEFNADELEALADSIRQHGLINPIAVEEADGAYILIDGERRWRAARLAGLEEIEASVRPGMNGSGKQERLVLAMVGNLQRTDMNPVEEGQAYLKLRKLGYSIDEIGKMVGLNKTNISTRLAILDFDPEIQALFAGRQLPLHYDAISGLKSVPADSRTRTAISLAGKKATITTIKMVCKRMANNQAFRDGEQHGAPAIFMVGKQARIKPLWNILSEIGKLPQWEKLEKGAMLVCQECELRDMASHATCDRCPAVLLLKSLITDET